MDEQKIVPWYYRPLPVIFLLIFVTGPLGLPLVYKSPKFNLAAKIGLTLLMGAYTWFLIAAGVETVKKTVSIYEQYRGILW